MWSDLNMTQRSELMKLYLKNGITLLSAMKEHYNSFATGGQMNTEGPDKPPVFINTRHPNNRNINQYGSVIERETTRDWASGNPIYESSRFQDGTRMQVLFNPSGVNDTVIGTYPMPTRHINPEVFVQDSSRYATYDNNGNPIWHEGTPQTTKTTTGNNNSRLDFHSYPDGGLLPTPNKPDALSQAASDNNYFIKNWLTQRSNILDQNTRDNQNFVQNWFYKPGSELTNQLNKLGSVQTYSNGIKELPNIAPTSPLLSNGLYMESDGMYYGKQADGSFQTAQGLYRPDLHQIYINPLENRDRQASAIVHERTHSLGLTNPQVQAINRFQQEEFLGEGQQGNKYNDTPWEIYSRLMQFRHDNNIDPTKVWKIEEIQQLRDNIKGDSENDILQRYNDNFLLHLFNDVAQNTSSSQDTAHYAALGGHLFYDGGTDGSKEDKNYLLDLLRINFKST